MTQPPLNFDAEAAEAAKQDGMRPAHRHANPAWIKAFYEAARRVAAYAREFTADDIFAELERDPEAPTTHQHRAAGQVIKRLERDGVLKLTDRTRNSVRKSNHRTTIRVYRSFIYQGGR